MNNDIRYTTCKKCGQVHFSVSLAYVQNNVNTFNEYFDTLSIEDQQTLYNGQRSSITPYTKCVVCGNPYTNFKLFENNDCPSGVTINPILERNEKL
jgi:hypothetical protein